MPRNLADVLHHLLPEVEEPTSEVRSGPRAEGEVREAPWSIPLDDGDLVRAALVANLAVAIASRGCRVRLLAPAASPLVSLLPEPEACPKAVTLHTLAGQDPERFLEEAAALPPPSPHGRTLTLACPAPDWLPGAAGGGLARAPLLLLVRPGEEERERALGLLITHARAAPRARRGVTLHGVESIAEARSAFLDLAAEVEARSGAPLASYGLLWEDLELCRSMVTRRPLVLERPRAPSARALADVARLLLLDLEAEEGDRRA